MRSSEPLDACSPNAATPVPACATSQPRRACPRRPCTTASAPSRRWCHGSARDLIDAEAAIPAIVRAAAESGDPRDVVAMSARVTRSILEHSGDIVHALITGAAAEPALATALEEGQRRRVEGARGVVSCSTDSTPRPGLDRDDAVRRWPPSPTSGSPSSERLRLVARPDRELDRRHKPDPAARPAPSRSESSCRSPADSSASGGPRGRGARAGTRAGGR